MVKENGYQEGIISKMSKTIANNSNSNKEKSQILKKKRSE